MVCLKLNGTVLIPPGDRDRTVSGGTLATHFGALKVQNVFPFNNLMRFCLNNPFSKIFNAIFSEQSCLTSMSFLFNEQLASGQYTFSLLNPACKETETIPVPRARVPLTSGW